MIPFVDLKSQYVSIKSEIDAAVSDVIESCEFIGGRHVDRFEQNFAEYLGVKHCVGCANGTDAIEILLSAFEIGSGDEVIIPVLTWISTSEAVRSVGATPVFVDAHPEYFTIAVAKIEEKITPKTKAIIPVHLYGQPAEMDGIIEIANRHNLIVIEDAAQAHGAAYKGKVAATIGHAGSFSFYPGKNLGAYGDAGAMVTNDDEIAEKIKMIRNHGQKGKHNPLIDGRNSRLDSIQAAILDTKLKHLNSWASSRIHNAEIYNQNLDPLKVKIPTKPAHSKHIYHLYVIESKRRDELQIHLKSKGIQCAIHYPKALHQLPVYNHLGYSNDHFPIASKQVSQILSLPMFPELTEPHILEVCEAINSF
jgi:dTDP-4-amino-4,6-dideoxygalactose transaminase